MTTATQTADQYITIRCRAFTGGKIADHKLSVSPTGTVRVYDEVAGYYTTCHSLSKSAVRRAIAASRKGPAVAIVCGKTIQIDHSGVGHCWRNLPASELTDDLADVLTAEILDGGEHGRVNIGGVHYRWQ